MNDIDIFLILYLILTLLISFVISFLYLNYFRNKALTNGFTFYFSVFCFGFIIYLIFLVLLDHAISIKTKILDNSLYINDIKYLLEKYYQYFGWTSKIITFLFGPLMIFYSTTGFYNKCDISKDILIRLKNKYLTLINICLAIVLSIPVFVLLYLGKLGDFYKSKFQLILNYLNYYSYLRILFYIGFIMQNHVRMFFLKNDIGENENYNIWKLGKIYFYYEREKINIKKNYKKIKKEVEQYFKEHEVENEEFSNNLKKFEKYVKFSLTNIIYIEPDIEGIKLSSKKYKKNYVSENINNEELFGLNNQNEELNIINNNDNLDNQDDEKEFNYLKKVFELYKNIGQKEEECKCSCCCDCNCSNCCNCCICCNNCCSSSKKKVGTFKEFKNDVCSLMDIVYELCVSIQRKSYLIDKSSNLIFNDNMENCCLGCLMNCARLCIFIFLIFFLLILEFPLFELGQYNSKELDFSVSIVIWIIFFCSVVFYFLIFNYSVIHHQYFDGNIIYGKKQSQNVNYYNFILLMLDLINALLFHSFWVLNKSQKIEAKYSQVFILKPIYIKNNINIVPIISITFIIIGIYNTATFSKLKLCGKNIFVFNERADFFGFNENYYGNFLIGCGCLIFIAKNGLLYNKEDLDLKDIDIDQHLKNESDDENEKKASLL